MLSVIIPTYNRNDLLIMCLDKLAPEIQSISSSEYEVIVTDDSKNGIADSLIESNYKWATWIPGPQKGPAANRNNGAKCAKGEWLVFIDDDCLPQNKLLSGYLEYIKNNREIKVFEGSIIADRPRKSFLEEAPANSNGGFLWSCNFMIKKSLFEDLQGFDESFPFASTEDVDLHYRIQKLNESILFARNAVVVHPWRLQSDLMGMTKKRFLSWIHFIKKHPEKDVHKTLFNYIRDISRFLIKHTLFKIPSYGVKGIGTHLRSFFFEMHLNIKYKRKAGRG